jgi:D-arabinose 1-dehydrogenase-like Zn-dependent alcohol dehydrogenase
VAWAISASSTPHAWAFASRPSCGQEKEPLSKQLGAHHYIDSKAGDPAATLRALGGAKLILATASDSKSMSELFGGLGPRGRMIVAGVGSSQIEVSPSQLLFGSRGIEGTLTGSSSDNEDTLAFSVLHRIKPMIETMPLEKAAEGYQRMLSNQARFRMVIVTGRSNQGPSPARAGDLAGRSRSVQPV